MKRNLSIVLFVLAFITIIVGVDILFLRHHLWLRLMVNIGIVASAAAIYLKFLNKPKS